MNAHSPLMWRSTLKSAVFGLRSSFPPPVHGGGGLGTKSVSKANVLLDHFDGKQSSESVDLTLTCHLSSRLTTFRSSKVRHLVLDFHPYGGTDPVGMFPYFLRDLLMFWPPVLV